MFTDYPHAFCPYEPHPKQRLVPRASPTTKPSSAARLAAARAHALLMAALQYVDVAGYAALILRKDLQRLALPAA